MKLFTFPGQGAQFPGMGREVFENFSEAREVFEEASDHCSLDLKKLIFEGLDTELAKTENTQPAIFTVSLAVWRSLKNFCDFDSWSQNALFMGHSLGEYSALVAAEALPLGPTAFLLKRRGQLMQEAVPSGQGAMAALLINPRFEGDAFSEVKNLCRELDSYVDVANYNSPTQIVVSGMKEGVEAFSEFASKDNKLLRRVVPLNVSAPFHCDLMQEAQKKLELEIQKVSGAVSSSSYIANVDAQNYSLKEGDEASVKRRLIQQVSGSVLWHPSLEKAKELGVKEHWEFGPSGVLSGLANKLKWKEWEVRQPLEKLEDIKNAFD